MTFDSELVLFTASLFEVQY